MIKPEKDVRVDTAKISRAMPDQIERRLYDAFPAYHLRKRGSCYISVWPHDENGIDIHAKNSWTPKRSVDYTAADMSALPGMSVHQRERAAVGGKHVQQSQLKALPDKRWRTVCSHYPAWSPPCRFMLQSVPKLDFALLADTPRNSCAEY